MTRPGPTTLLPGDGPSRLEGSSNPLVRALTAFVHALDQRYPGGPDELPDAGLAIDAVEANMRTVFDDEGSPAA
jgi:hypothetical protein